MIVIKCESAIGVLRGTKWARKLFVFLIALNQINPSQNGSAKLRVKAKWAVRVNT